MVYDKTRLNFDITFCSCSISTEYYIGFNAAVTYHAVADQKPTDAQRSAQTQSGIGGRPRYGATSLP